MDSILREFLRGFKSRNGKEVRRRPRSGAGDRLSPCFLASWCRFGTYPGNTFFSKRAEQQQLERTLPGRNERQLAPPYRQLASSKLVVESLGLSAQYDLLTSVQARCRTCRAPRASKSELWQSSARTSTQTLRCQTHGSASLGRLERCHKHSLTHILCRMAGCESRLHSDTGIPPRSLARARRDC